MKVVKSKRKENTVFLEIEESPDVLRGLMDAVYPRVAKNAQVKGFRKGKVPRDVFERYYGKRPIIEEALSETIDRAYRQAITELDLAIVDRPENVSIEPYEADKAIRFSCEVMVAPEVKLGKYKKIKLKKESTDVTDEAVQTHIDTVRDRYSTFKSVTRSSQTGDMMRFNLVATINNEPYALWTREQAGTLIGNGPFGADFDTQVTGSSIGDERDFEIHYDDTIKNPDVVGKVVHFSLKVTDIQEKQQPDVTDEWVATVGDHKTVAAYYASVRQQLEKQKAETAQNNQREALLSAVIDDVPMVIPGVMTDQQVTRQFQYFEQSLKQQGFTLAQFEKQVGKDAKAIKEEMQPSAEKQVKIDLVIAAIAKKEAITVSDEALEAEIRKWNQPDIQTIEEAKQKGLAGNIEHIRHQQCYEKTISFLLSEAKLVN